MPHSVDPGFIYGQTGNVEVTHNGTSDSQVEVHITNSDAVVGGDYEVYFDQQAYELDLEGNWSPVSAVAGKLADVSGTTITGAAVSSPNVGTIDVVFQLEVATTDYNCVQGVELTFGDDVNINSASGATIDGQTVLFGANVADGSGAYVVDHMY